MEQTPESPSQADRFSMDRIDWLIAAVLSLATCLLYLPTLGFDFVDFDDLHYIVNNEAIRDGFSVEAVGRLFTTFRKVNWIPVTELSHMLDLELFGMEPAGHHATSIVLHSLNAALLFICLLKLSGAR